MLVGRQTWRFVNKPKIISTGTIGGPLEKNSFLQSQLDLTYDDLWLEKNSFEKAQQIIMEQSVTTALNKVKITEDDVDFFFTGDLTNQITPSTFAAKTLNIPYFGLFSACATMTEGLALAAQIIDAGHANYIISGTSSHFAAAERQFRNPTEYGGQKPPTAQSTVTGAGSALISKHKGKIAISAATIGRVCDYGETDPYNMGTAMAPAAVDTILTHLDELKLCASEYDLILTGDLGHVGHAIALEMLEKNKIQINEERFQDAGALLFEHNEHVQAGGSGPACIAIVTYSYIIQQLIKKKLNKVLIVATGALHSPLTVQQNCSIPAIAHAVVLENVGDNQ